MMSKLLWICSAVLLMQSVAVTDGKSPTSSGPFGLPFGMEIVSSDHHLGINSAFLSINSTVDDNITIFGQTDECYKCPLLHVANITAGGHISLVVDTSYGVQLTVCGQSDSPICNNDTKHFICKLDKHFGDHGSYSLFISFNLSSSNVMCNMVTSKPPVDEFLPIIISFCIVTGVSLLAAIGQCLLRSKLMKPVSYNFTTNTDSLVDKDLGPSESLDEQVVNNTSVEAMKETQGSDKPSRLRSLDTFRGLSLVVMVFVNYGGGKYWMFHHSRWNGLTVADTVFPWFVFIIGVSVAIAFHNAVSRGRSRRQLLVKLTKRTLILFALGIILNTSGPVRLTELRVPGVLQRLAASYFAVAVIELAFNDATKSRSVSRVPAIRDLTNNVVGWVMIIVCVVSWLLITFYLPVPDCPKGYLGPGGLYEYESHPEWTNCTGGAAGYIDRWFFGDTHIYQRDTSKKVYQGQQPYDPEGMLGTLTSIFLAYLGVQAGRIILTYSDHTSRVVRFLIWSAVTGLLALGLCGATKDDGIIPINKNLWSLSFVLSMGSTAFLLLAIMYVIIDVKKWWGGSPFYEPGMNSILVYVGHEMFHNYFPFSWKANPTHSEHLAMNLLGAFYWVLIAMFLDYQKFYLAI